MGAGADQHPDCFACHKHSGEIAVTGGPIYEDALVYAGHAAEPPGRTTVYPSYLIAEPKRHARGWEDLTDQEAAALGQLLARLCRALRATEGTEHIYVAVLGDHVPHLHVHLLPRYPGTPREYWGLRVDEWPDAPKADRWEVTQVCERAWAYLHSQ
jgi:diadenosine tetraphosphate (Ap4A) HIT family hydrolase